MISQNLFFLNKFTLCASYKVRKEPFTPSVGIIAPSVGDDSLTDNYLEMVN